MKHQFSKFDIETQKAILYSFYLFSICDGNDISERKYAYLNSICYAIDYPAKLPISNFRDEFKISESNMLHRIEKLNDFDKMIYYGFLKAFAVIDGNSSQNQIAFLTFLLNRIGMNEEKIKKAERDLEKAFNIMKNNDLFIDWEL